MIELKQKSRKAEKELEAVLLRFFLILIKGFEVKETFYDEKRGKIVYIINTIVAKY